MSSNFRAMTFCTVNMLQSDKMPIQILITQQSWNGLEEEIAVAYLLMRRMRKRTEKRKSKKESLSRIFQEMKRKVLLYFVIISARASSLWILHLLVLPMIFCQRFCGLIFWHFLSHKFTNQKKSESLALMILHKTHAVMSEKHRIVKENQKI